ncbi:hypothetical protein PsorP6_012755 [Peronosclerospora sorghi]|uniref:Uncharacterized protein n=1 Tax=Peronosclerospora sorghi TaxID=230839 RepID=A0ACC0WHT8_9STRA|nr:hypothetical protein PsorP6_012755 [Peronosclerospora sorghi]
MTCLHRRTVKAQPKPTHGTGAWICEYRLLDNSDDRQAALLVEDAEKDDDEFTDTVWVQFETVNKARMLNFAGYRRHSMEIDFTSRMRRTLSHERTLLTNWRCDERCYCVEPDRALSQPRGLHPYRLRIHMLLLKTRLNLSDRSYHQDLSKGLPLIRSYIKQQLR